MSGHDLGKLLAAVYGLDWVPAPVWWAAGITAAWVAAGLQAGLVVGRAVTLRDTAPAPAPALLYVPAEWSK